ncbi:MAG: glycerol-3-phosphate 1-O-acyltransferase PlsB [Pseudomonadota bacterium]|nr:glycerol-3-phosphate 1-O-acyltransferase PlsB [Pseudomonadota bacterium]
MSKKNSLSAAYRRISSALLDLAVSPHVLGEIPQNLHSQPSEATPRLAATPETVAATESSNTELLVDLHSNPERPVCYVLQQYSRSNVLLVDGEARRQHIRSPLEPMESYLLNEEASIIFLQHKPSKNPNQPNSPYVYPPRLVRLIDALAQNPMLDVDLVPVTVLWGRAPDKEDSWFKLLMADSWGTPSTIRQLMNIGIHGRQTYVQFHEPISLRKLCEQGQQQQPGLLSASYVVRNLSDYLARQREIVLGPDLSDRRNLVDDLMQSAGIQSAIQAEVIRSNLLPDYVNEQARGYLDEILSDYSYSAIRFLERGLTWLWTQLYDGVEVHHFQGIRELAEDYEIIYAPCHRSHIDYLLLSFVIYRRGLMVPYIAAGDNLNMPFVGSILRGGGAFFIRRSFKGNALYTAVFKEYLHSILSRNTPIEYFIEGGRSRSGRLLPPKTGMLAMTVHSQMRGAGKPVALIPTYIGYERLMEGSTYVGEMQGKPKEAESILGLIGAARKIERIFGKVHVSFGAPVFVNDALKKHQLDQHRIARNDDPLPAKAAGAISELAEQVMKNINSAAVITPVSLLSLVLLSTPKHALDEDVCIKQIDTYLALAQAAPYDARIQITNLSGREIIAYGLKLKLIKHVNHLLGDMIAIESDQGVLLTYFRNNILHLFILSSLIASLIVHNGKIHRDDISGLIDALYPFLQAELFLKWGLSELPDVLERELCALIEAELVLDDGTGTLYSPAPNTEAYSQLTVLAAPVQQSLERYFMTLTLITQQGSGRMTAKQIEDLSHLLGQRLSVLYEFDAPEFFDRALFRSFVDALAKLEYLTIDDEQLIHFGHQLERMAEDSRLVLNLETLNTLQHMTFVTDAEVEAAMHAMAKKKERRPKKA